MISLLKTFGKGLLYVIGAPFFLVALALFGVIGLFAFIFQIIKSIIYFFTGQSFFPELAEDKKLRLMKEAAEAQNQPQENSVASPVITPIQNDVLEEQPQPVFVQKEAPAPTIEETVFEDTSSLEDFIEEDHVEETPIESEYDDEPLEEEHTVLQTNDEEETTEDDFEELETYVPRSSTYSDASDDEDNDTSSGVDIDYNL